MFGLENNLLMKPVQPKRRRKTKNMQDLNIVALQDMTIAELGRMAKSLGLAGYSGLRKQDLISLIVEAKATRNDGLMFGGGVLEVLPEGYGFLRSYRYNYLQSKDDIYVSHSQVRKFDLRTGHMVEGQIHSFSRKVLQDWN